MSPTFSTCRQAGRSTKFGSAEDGLHLSGTVCQSRYILSRAGIAQHQCLPTGTGRSRTAIKIVGPAGADMYGRPRRASIANFGC